MKIVNMKIVNMKIVNGKIDISKSDKRFRLFPITLIGRVKDRPEALPCKTITTWVKLEKLFLIRFYSINNFVHWMPDITRFEQ